MNQVFITLTIFYQILVSSNPLKTRRHAFQSLHCVISARFYDQGARWSREQNPWLNFFEFLGHILMVRSPYNCSLTLFLTVKIMKMIFVICCLDMRAVLPKPSWILAYIAKWHQNALGLLEAPYLHNFVNILCITDSFMPFDAVFGSSVELCSFEIMCNYYSD